MSRKSMRPLVAVAVALAALLAAAPGAQAKKSDELWLRFDNTEPGKSIKHPVNSGKSHRVVITVKKAKHGKVIARKAKPTKSRVADFPNYAPGGGAPRAVVAVLPGGKKDPLNPRKRPFAFGADFRIDEAAIAPRDDGNNLIQRGFYSQAPQYKIQVDKSYIECRVKGSQGDVFLRSADPVSSKYWYRVSCAVSRAAAGKDVTLTVNRLTKRGRVVPVETVSENAVLGRVKIAKERPLTIGGRLKDNLSVPSRVEQFNGRVDNAFFRIN
ncbi:MAG: hypothetical protein QM714_01950 [Nocardioides sp.]|uniref:hypothetical protein n=1 Tax=Nocardioides sp. TaxID=35761 RepID=UPI0039E23B73